MGMVVVTNESELLSALADGGIVELDENVVITLTASRTISASNTTIRSVNPSKKGTIILKAKANWDSGIPLFSASGRTNLVFDSIIISANMPNQSGESRGKGYYNLVNLRNCSHITIKNCELRDGGCDGFQFRGCTDIKAFGNKVSYLGHDVFYFIGSNSNIEVYNNDVLTFTNSAVRLSYGCTNAWIHDNHFHSVFTGGSTGPAIEIDKHGFSGILIENNYIHDINGAAIWMPADAVNNGSIIIRNNIIVNTGVYKTYTGYSNAAIVNGGMNGCVINNNTIVGGNVAYATFDRNGLSTTYSVTFDNNIVMGTKIAAMRMTDVGGSVSAKGNCLWNNEAILIGPYTSKVTLTGSINKNPALDSDYKPTASTPAGVGAYSSSSPGPIENETDPEPEPTPQALNQCARIRMASAATNFKNSPYLDVGASTTPVRSLLQFDLSALKEPVYKAVIKLCWYYPSDKVRVNDSIVEVFRPAAAWSEATATWTSAQQYFDASGIKGGTKSYCAVVIDNESIPKPTTVEFDVTALVNEYITGKYVNTGFMFKCMQEVSDYIAFYSLNWTAAAQRPVLEITAAAPTTSVKIPVSAANRLRESNPATVYTDTVYLDVGRSTKTARFIVYADLSTLKAPVQKATLDLAWYYPEGKSRIIDTVVHVYRSAIAPSDTVTWNTGAQQWYDATDVAQGNVPFGTVTLKAAVLPDDKFECIDITELVNKIIDGTYENTGFFIKALIENNNYVAFRSQTYGNAELRPRVTITAVETAV